MSDIVCIKREIGDGDAAMWRTLYQQRGEEIKALRAELADRRAVSLSTESLARIADALTDIAMTYNELHK